MLQHFTFGGSHMCLKSRCHSRSGKNSRIGKMLSVGCIKMYLSSCLQVVVQHHPYRYRLKLPKESRSSFPSFASTIILPKICWHGRYMQSSDTKKLQIQWHFKKGYQLKIIFSLSPAILPLSQIQSIKLGLLYLTLMETPDMM